ncbi:MAG TPA: hypothetical protein VGN94_08285, partial [Methylobacterium sp.]|nr:hypothetical protein [Methylobacterium sp.]
MRGSFDRTGPRRLAPPGIIDCSDSRLAGEPGGLPLAHSPCVRRADMAATTDWADIFVRRATQPAARENPSRPLPDRVRFSLDLAAGDRSAATTRERATEARDAACKDREQDAAAARAEDKSTRDRPGTTKLERQGDPASARSSAAKPAAPAKQAAEARDARAAAPAQNGVDAAADAAATAEPASGRPAAQADAAKAGGTAQASLATAATASSLASADAETTESKADDEIADDGATFGDPGLLGLLSGLALTPPPA